jgi:hypothetical protein
MNDPTPKDFERHLDPVIDSIAASPARKSIMREEMLAHLLDSYQAEQSKTDERAAIRTAINRLGSTDELRLQLQASVPTLERILFAYLNRKETFMSRLLWVVAIVAIVAGDNLSFPLHEQLFLAGMLLLSGLVFRHLCQKDNLASRLIGTHASWLVGCFVILSGTAIILPAMAKMKHEQAFSVLQIEFMTAGALITLGGLYFVVHTIKMRLARPA